MHTQVRVEARINESLEGVDDAHKLGTMNGVFVPTCENMWGVLIFLRFNYIVGHAGVLEGWGIVLSGHPSLGSGSIVLEKDQIHPSLGLAKTQEFKV